MAKTKISKVAADLNITFTRVIEFLREKGISVDENPNARLDEDVVSMLMSAFKSDVDAKKISNGIRSERKESKARAAEKNNREPETIVTTTQVQKPHIVGHVELDAKGRVVGKPSSVQKPRPADPTVTTTKESPVKPTKPAETVADVKPVNDGKAAVKSTAADKPAAEAKPTSEAKPEVKPTAADKPAADVKEVKTQAEDKTSTTDKEQTARLADAKTSSETQKDAQQASTANDGQTTDNTIFTTGHATPTPSIKIVGTIDLDALNRSLHPKKKVSTVRNGRTDQTVEGERKKRHRITGKEKVDIEKVGRTVSDNRNNNGGRGNGNNNGNGNNRKNAQRAANGGGRGERRKAAPQPEVTDEDVQKQVKETLARLTAKDKNVRKGVLRRKEKREAGAAREREHLRAEEAESRILKITEFVSANELALMMNVPVNEVISTCMNLGVMVSINQRLDAETINIVADEFGFQTEYVSAEVADAIHQEADAEEDLVSRSPVVTVMGHVDHGKTSLLDYIRSSNVIAGEAGGITQHIGAYSVKLPDGRNITFLDTPGHEAFTAMRARGAKITDIVIIIVAADDAVMPQTVEAINHASAAGVPIVFAINKIDKPHANPEKIKEELAAMNYLVEDWGGKYQSQDISAKKGTGVKELMEKVLLEAEMLNLRANPNRRAVGTIIESSLDKGRGYVANVLVQNGTLRVGDIVLAGNHFGRIKAMFNERNQRIKEAGPAIPALILGLNGAPQAGDTFNVLETEQEAREIANKREQLAREQGLRTTKILTLDDIARRRAIGNFKELNIIVKGDVDGSIEALSDSLIKLSTEEVQVNVLHKAVGEISESDVTLAAASDAVIIGFQVRPSLAARRSAEREGVEIRLYSIIYQAIEDVKSAMAGMLAPEIKEEILGTAEVLETFHVSKVGTIAGANVREGKIKRSCKVRLIRDGIVRYTGELGSLKRFKDDVKEVSNGYECGLSIVGYNDVKPGDLIEAFEETEVARTTID